MIRLLAAVVAVALVAPGCATLFNQGRTTVSVGSATPGQKVTIDGIERGETPMSIALDGRKSHTVAIVTEDGQVHTCELTASVGAGWVILDLLAGLVPLVIDAITGGWYSLDTDVCHSPRQPEDPDDF